MNQARIDKLYAGIEQTIAMQEETLLRDVPILISRDRVGGSMVISVSQGGAFKFWEPIEEDTEEVISIVENSVFTILKQKGYNVSFNTLKKDADYN